MTVIESEPLKTQWASNQIRKIAGWACAVNAGNVSPHRRLQRKPLVSDPGMRHGTCVTHVPWCMSGSLTCGGGGNVPGIPGACAPTILRIWQEAHVDRIRWRSEASIVYFLYRTYLGGIYKKSIITIFFVQTTYNSRRSSSSIWYQRFTFWHILYGMMTSSNGNIFRVADPLWGESPG